jgi:hypothetical protein
VKDCSHLLSFSEKRVSFHEFPEGTIQYRRPTAVPPTCGRPCWTRQSLVIRCLLMPCARILSRGKSLLGLRAGRAGREPTFMRRDRILYHAFKKFAASRPKAMKNPPPPVIASEAKQSPGRYGDCFAACGGSQCNGRKFSTATVENFLPQQKWIVGGQLVGNYPCPHRPRG